VHVYINLHDCTVVLYKRFVCSFGDCACITTWALNTSLIAPHWYFAINIAHCVGYPSVPFPPQFILASFPWYSTLNMDYYIENDPNPGNDSAGYKKSFTIDCYMNVALLMVAINSSLIKVRLIFAYKHICYL